MRLIKTSLVLIFLSLAACSQSAVVAANLPTLFSNQKITHDLEFGSKYGSKLDVYMPDDQQASHPVIIFFYGGKWNMGDKDIYRFAADAFTSRGYVVVIPDYVKYPKYKFPVWQEDAAKAVAWTHNDIGHYKGNPKQLFIMGHSAGAQIGALLTADNRYLAKEGGSRQWIKAFAGLAGPYDFTPTDDDIKDMFSTAGKNYREMRVSNFIDGGQAPMLLLWGKDDKDVGYVNIERLEAALKAKGGKYQVKLYDDVNHIDIIAALTVIRRSAAPVVEDVDQFFKTYRF